VCGTDNEADVTGETLPLGTAVHDCARVTGAVEGFPIAGTLTYRLFWTGNCQGPWVDEALIPLGTESSPTTLESGSYSYLAMFIPSDGNYRASMSGCQPFTIGDGTFHDRAPREIRRYGDGGDDGDDESGDWGAYANALPPSMHASVSARDEVEPLPVDGTFTDEVSPTDERSRTALRTWVAPLGPPTPPMAAFGAGSPSLRDAPTAQGSYEGVMMDQGALPAARAFPAGREGSASPSVRTSRITARWDAQLD
jgi:hypothetical protein